ncbi:MAG: AraC family transcriptional regulator [Candidatus Aminicenantes bacterium]|nr:MAG: AraC family transcriptional regulator [Candidatus Aminicenantes bacterium]
MDSKKLKDSADFEIFRWMIKYIWSLKDHQLRELNVSRLSHELNMSRSYLYDLFKTYKINSPGWLLKRIRIIRASELLLEKPRLSVKKVSTKIGFNTVDYFIRVFKDYFGTTPLKYRRYYQEERPGGAVDIPGV